MPRVSVVIPAHNAAPFLPAALESVRAQTFTDWEVVAVDDGSSDETWSILESAGPRVRGLRNPQAAGPAAARNRALAEATGELVAFLDADDLLLPRYLESQIACLEAAPGGRAESRHRHLRRPRARGGALRRLHLPGRGARPRPAAHPRARAPSQPDLHRLAGAGGGRSGGRVVRPRAVRHRGLRAVAQDPRARLRGDPQPGAARRVPAARRHGLLGHRPPGRQQPAHLRARARPRTAEPHASGASRAEPFATTARWRRWRGRASRRDAVDRWPS